MAVTVADTPLTGYSLSISGVASTVASQMTVGGFADTNTLATSSDYTLSINWGDNSQPSSGSLVSMGPGSFQVQGSHAYSTAGTYTIVTTVTDKGGQSTTLTSTARVVSPWTVLPASSGAYSLDPQKGQLVPLGEASVDLGQGALRLSHPLDFDQSPGTSIGRDPALVYNSATVQVRPVIQLSLQGDPAAAAPTQVSVQLTFNGVQQSPVVFSTSSLPAGSVYLLSVQPSSAVTTSGAYSWSAALTITFPNNSQQTANASGTAYVVARDSSPYGAGWGIDGIDQLVPTTGGVLYVTGEGDSRFFASAGGGAFTSPAEDFGTLVQNQDGSYTYTAKDQTKYNFSSAGFLASVVDTHGLATSYQYDSQNRLKQVAAIDGGVTTLGYDLNTGLLNQITEPGNRVLTFQHDASGNLTQINDVDNTTRTFGYDTAHHLTEDQWAPLDATFGYNGSTGLLSSVNRGLGSSYTISAAAAAGLGMAAAGPALATVTDGLSHTTKYQLDLRGRLLKQIQADNTSSSNVLDAAGQVTLSIDPLGRPTFSTYAYGAYNQTLGGGDGDLVGVQYADGSSVQYQYDSTFHHLTQTTDQLGRVSNNSYDPTTGDLLSSTKALGQTTTYAWANGLLLSVTTPGPNGVAVTSSNVYDSARRLAISYDNLAVPTYYQYDTSGNLSATIDALGRQTQTLYSPDNLLLKQIDANAGVTTWAYNAYGLVTSQTNARGLTQTTQYDQRGLVSSMTDYSGATTTNQYDAAGNLISTTDALNHKTQYGYDLQNRQVTVTDPTGAVSQTGYDAAGNVISTTDALGHQTINRYDVLGQLVASTDPMGRSTYTQYDLAGNAIRTTDGGGLSTFTAYDALNRAVQSLTLSAAGTYVGNQTVYDPAGNVAQTIDGLGLATTYYYDADNRQIGTKDPLGLTTATTYDLVGNVTSTTDQRGKSTTYVYDVLNRQIQVTDPDNNVTQTAYDAVGNVIESIDPKQGVVGSTYDADNRVLSVEDADGYLSQQSYDAVGNVIKSIDENGQVTQTWYDADNRPVLVLDPNGHWTQAAYNALGSVISTTDGAGDVATDGYDADNELTLVQDGDNNQTQYGFDQSGRRVSEIDPDNNQTRTAFDTLGDAAVCVDALGNATVQLFDKDGRLTTSIDADGRAKTYSYDNDGNVLTETWYNADGSLQQTITYTWDNDGNLLTATNSNGTVTRTYDAAGQMQTQTDVWGLKLTYGYDNNGNVISVTDSLGGQVTSRYDGDNRLVSRKYSGPNNQQARFDLTYTKAGQIATMTRYADTAGTQKVGSSQWTYDNAGNTLQIQHKDGNGNVLGTFAYGYDAANRVSSETDNGGSPTNYGYDKASQLISAGSNTYGFDANGNRNTSGYQVNAGNLLKNDGTWGYQYDNVGNVVLKTNNTTGETWAYTWDDNNQLVGAVHKDSSGNVITQVTLKYDGLGQLVEEDVYTQSTGQTVVTRYAWDRGNIWADLDGNGNLLTRRLYRDGSPTPVARISASGTVNWYLPDQLGSVRLIVDNTGTVQDAINYDAWGNITSESQPGNGDRYKYAGLQWDATLGLDKAAERWYYPPAGFWYGQDPLGLLADSNPYRYVGNEPTDWTDISGLVKGPPSAVFINPRGDAAHRWSVQKVDPAEYERFQSSLDSYFARQRLEADVRDQLRRAANTAYQEGVPADQIRDVLNQDSIYPIQQAANHKEDDLRKLSRLWSGSPRTCADARSVGLSTEQFLACDDATQLAAKAGGNITPAERLARVVGFARAVGVPEAEIKAAVSADDLRQRTVPYIKKMLDRDPQQLLMLMDAPRITPGGRIITDHALDRMTNPPPGRAAMTPEEVDQVLDTGNRIKKITAHPEGDTITVQNTMMPGKPQVVVDAETGKRVITVIKNKE